MIARTGFDSVYLRKITNGKVTASFKPPDEGSSEGTRMVGRSGNVNPSELPKQSVESSRGYLPGRDIGRQDEEERIGKKGIGSISA